VPCGNACPEGRGIGLTLFHLNDTNDLVPASAPAAFMSVCSIDRVEHPAACLLARACQRLWLFGGYGAYGGSHVLDISFSLEPPTALTLAVAENASRRSPCRKLRFVVSTAFDPAVTSYADVDRLLRTEPQVQLTPFVLNNHPNGFKSHRSTLPATPHRQERAKTLGALPHARRKGCPT